MDAKEVKAICKQVVADRKRKKSPVDAPRPLRFTNGRFIRGVADLDEAGLRQLVAVGRDGIGAEKSPEELLAGQDEDDDEGESLYKLEAWDVVDAKGALACRVFIYLTDNGTVFRGDTIEVVVGCSQGGLESQDEELVKDLVAARKAIAKKDMPKGSCIKFFGD